jgi:hypothetical protein
VNGERATVNGNCHASWRLCVVASLAASAACARGPAATPERQAEVRVRAPQVMPFDLAKTHHVFEKLADGGLQTVTAKDAGDSVQVRLIREHLLAESERFARGDFTDPMTLHGHSMPGLEELRTGAARIAVRYADRAGGGEIRYRTSEPGLVAALHRWFDAQLMDHGADASSR